MAATGNRDSVNLWDAIQEAVGKGKSLINGLTKAKAQEELGVSRKNWIINGDHQVNQRGLLPVTGMTVDAYENTDRWTSQRSVVVADSSLSNKWLKATVTTGGTGYFGFSQKVEDYALLAGKTLTLSARVNTNASNVYFRYYDGSNGYFKAIPVGNNESTFTFNLSSSASALWIQIITYPNATTASVAGDYIEFTNAKLEIGDTATPFEVEPYAEVLRKCQRYYVEICDGTVSEAIGVVAPYGTSYANGSYQLPVPMRIAPTTTISAASDFEAVGASSIPTLTNLTFGGSTTTSLALIAYFTMTASTPYQLRTKTAAASIKVNAEL